MPEEVKTNQCYLFKDTYNFKKICMNEMRENESEMCAR